MLGAIVGDIVGSVYELNNRRSKDFPLIREDSHFTDDTILTIATADALMSASDGNYNFAAKYREYGQKYPSSYGNRFQDWINEVITGPYGSYGNGSAMRVSPIAWYFDDSERVLEVAKASAEVTHDHPEGIKGAQATALAILYAREGKEPSRIARDIEQMFGYDLSTPVEVLRETSNTTRPARARFPRRSAVSWKPRISRTRSALRSASAGIPRRYRGNVEYCGGEVGYAGGDQEGGGEADG